MPRKALELFSGTDSVGRVLRSLGWEVVSVDNGSEWKAGDPWGQPTHRQLLKEATRLLRVGGRVGLLHFQVPMFRKPLRMVGVWGITTGLGYNIRAWSVFEKMAEPVGNLEAER